MHSDTSGETTELEQSHPDRSSRVDGLRAWLSTHPLKVETGLAAASVSLGFLALPIVVFGSFVALGGETGILSVGMIIVAAGLLCLVALAAAVLVHAYTEIRHQGLPSSDGLDILSVFYGGARAVETLAAGTLLCSLLASVVSVFTAGSVPGLLGLTVGVAGILLPSIVFLHAAGAFVGYVFDLGRGRRSVA